MRTGLVLLARAPLFAAVALVGELFSKSDALAATGCIVAFVAFVVWAGLAATNVGLGVFEAGYSVAEELPIFILIFGVPTIVAIA